MNVPIQHYPLRIVSALIVIAIGVSVHHMTSLAALLVIGQVWLLISRIPVRLFWLRFRFIIPFLIFSFIFFPLYEHGKHMELFGTVSVSLDGLKKAAMYSGRLLFTVQTLTLLFFHLPVHLFFQSLVRLKVPDIFVEIILFTLRYMELFRLEAKNMLKSLRSRGWKSGQWFSVRSYAVLSKLLGSLLLRSFRRSDRIYMGMLSRGYKGRIPAVTTKADSRDVFVMILWIVPVAGVLLRDKI